MTSPSVSAGHPALSRFVLTLSCPDRPGIVYAVSAFLLAQRCNIVESEQYGDPASDTFFMRVQFESGPATSLAGLREEFGPVASSLSMSWRLVSATEKQRVLIMVSRLGHCLNDLLFRASTGWLNIEVVAVVSNHPDMGLLADNFGVPFHHIPVVAARKEEAEQQLMQLVDDYGVELVVLARYMQILSPELCKRLAGRAINIHHSMLPSFKGGSPYRQAHERGVKFIGATAHYVTPDLDEGPIIEQEVARINHAMSTTRVTAIGRDTECLALARAVQCHSENRVLLHGHRTVVFG